MANYELLKATKRAHKSVAPLHRLRKSGYVPALIFGKGIEPTAIQVKTLELKRCLAKAGQIFELDVDQLGKHLVNIDRFHVDPVKGKPLHIAFHRIEQNVETTIKLPILLLGKSPGVKEGGVVQQVLHGIHVTGKPKDMPELLELDISQLELNDNIHVSAISLPSGLEFRDADLELVAVTCVLPKKEEPAAETATLEAGEGTAVEGEESANKDADGASEKAS